MLIRASAEAESDLSEAPVVRSTRCKGRDAVTLYPCQRLSMSLNDEPENLLILPPLEISLLDKIILCKVFKRPLPMPAETDEERAALWAQIAREIPCWLHYLIHEHVIEPEHRSERYGVRHWHHPDLVRALDELTPEDEVCKLLEQALFDDRDEWHR